MDSNEFLAHIMQGYVTWGRCLIVSLGPMFDCLIGADVWLSHWGRCLIVSLGPMFDCLIGADVWLSHWGRCLIVSLGPMFDCLIAFCVTWALIQYKDAILPV